MLSIGQDTSFIIRVINYLVDGLPVKINEFIDEHIAPPFNPLTESQITASHLRRSNGSWIQRYSLRKFR
jgi:hypothetical protein